MFFTTSVVYFCH